MSSTPVIIIPAAGQSKLVYADKKSGKIRNAWPFELDEKALMDEMKGSLMKMMLFRTDAGFSDKVAGIVDDITQPLSVNADGTKKYDLSALLSGRSYAECDEEQKNFINKMYPVSSLAEKTGAENIFYFDYDFLGDISAVAASLDGLTEAVVAKTGSEKVSFIVYSTGGAVLKAYLKDYSVKSRVEKVFCVACALDGASVVADVYENKLNLENPAGLLSSLGGKAASLSSIAGVLPADVIGNVISKSMKVLDANILGGCTSLYALIPSDRADAVIASRAMNPQLREKVTAMNEYSKRFADEVKKLIADGVSFSFICANGKKLPEVFGSAGVDCDGIVDTVSATLGGAFAENTIYIEEGDHFSMLKNEKVREYIENNI